MVGIHGVTLRPRFYEFLQPSLAWVRPFHLVGDGLAFSASQKLGLRDGCAIAMSPVKHSRQNWSTEGKRKNYLIGHVPKTADQIHAFFQTSMRIGK